MGRAQRTTSGYFVYRVTHFRSKATGAECWKGKLREIVVQLQVVAANNRTFENSTQSVLKDRI